MHTYLDFPRPFRAAGNFEYVLNAAFKWDDSGRLPLVAVIFYEHDLAIRIADVINGPWSSEQEAEEAAKAAAQKWIFDNSLPGSIG